MNPSRYTYPKQWWTVEIIEHDGARQSLRYVDAHEARVRRSAMKRKDTKTILSIKPDTKTAA